jgi:hypothetical protein
MHRFDGFKWLPVGQDDTVNLAVADDPEAVKHIVRRMEKDFCYTYQRCI